MAGSKPVAGKGQSPLGVLVLSRPGKPVQRFQLSKPVISVGRAEGVSLRIPSPEISRKHCLLTFQEGFWQVKDQGSSNGTYVNGTRVAGLTQINPGSRLRFGKVEFVLQYTLRAEATRRLRQDQLLEALAVPAGEADEVELIELEELPEDSAVPAVPVEADLVLELDEDLPPIPVVSPAAATLREQPLLSLLPDEDDYPAIPLIPESDSPGMPPPIPEPESFAKPPLADLRDLLSQLAEPAPAPAKPKPKGKG